MGFTVEKVEHYNAWSHRYNDLFGVFDLLAIRENEGIIGVQVTTRDHLANRITKILDSHAAELWTRVGGRIVAHGWFKKGNRWRLKEEEITQDDFRLEDSAP